MSTKVIGVTAPETQVVGGKTPNQDTALGVPSDGGWQWWKVLAGIATSAIVFLGAAAGLYSVFGNPPWSESELHTTFHGTPMDGVAERFGQPDHAVTDPATGQLQQLGYRTAVRVGEKPSANLVTFHGENGRCVRIEVN